MALSSTTGSVDEATGDGWIAPLQAGDDGPLGVQQVVAFLSGVGALLAIWLLAAMLMLNVGRARNRRVAAVTAAVAIVLWLLTGLTWLSRG